MNNFPGPVRSPRMFKYKEKKRHLLTIVVIVYGMPKVAKFINIPHCI